MAKQKAPKQKAAAAAAAAAAPAAAPAAPPSEAPAAESDNDSMPELEPVPVTEAAAGCDAACSMLRSRLVFAFNNFFAHFLVRVKDSDELVKKRLKKTHRVLQSHSDAYLLHFWRACKASGALDAVFTDAEVSDARLAKLQVVQGLTVEQLGAVGADEMRTHLRLLCIVAYLFDELMEDESSAGELNALFERLMQAVSEGRGALKGILDTDALTRFEAVLDSIEASGDLLGGCGEGGCTDLACGEHSQRACGENRPSLKPDDLMSMMQDSLLGKIASEIAQEVDLQQLQDATERQDVQGMMQHIMSSGFMDKITEKLTSKIGSGQYNESDLMREATKMLGSFGMA